MRFFSDLFHDATPRKEKPVAGCCDMAELFVGAGRFLGVVKTNSIDRSAVIHYWRWIVWSHLCVNAAHRDNGKNGRAADRRRGEFCWHCLLGGWMTLDSHGQSRAISL